MSEQGRKQEDSAAHKSRTPTSISPSLGPSSSLLPYPLPPHDYTSHARLYPIMHPGISIPPPMAQSLQPSKPCLTNEMGPPIFMPSLNLGTPRSSSAVSSPLASSPASSAPGSSTGPSTSATSTAGGPVLAHSMSDMILSNAPSVTGFHTLHPFYPSGPGIRPGSGQPQYMAIPTAPSPQASAVGSNKRPPVSATTIAKPAPMQAVQPHSKVGSFVKNHPSHLQISKGMTVPSTTNKTVMIMTSSSGHGLHPATAPTSQTAPGSSVIKLSSRQSQPTHHQLQHQQGAHHSTQHSQSYPQAKPKVYINTTPDGNQESMPPVFFTTHPTMQGHVISVPYQAMLQPHATPNHPASSTLTELLAPSGPVVTSSLREGGKGKTHDPGVRPFSPHSGVRHGTTAPPRERSSSGDGPSGVMSPQTTPSQNISHATSAQPTPPAGHTETRLERPAQPSSTTQSSQLPSPQNVPSSYQGAHRERTNSSSEVSNIIISVPGLTGRHIAAISSNQPLGFSNGSQAQTVPPQLSDPYRGSRIKSEYGGGGGQVMDSTPVAVPHPTAMHMVPQSTPQVENSGDKSSVPSAPTFGQLATQSSSLTATVISSSSYVNSPGAPHPNSLPLSVPGSPLASLSPSRRPGIIRKRPHESSWKVDNTSSPTLTTKGSSVTPVPLASPGHAPPPLSPSHSHHSEPLTNHVTSTARADPTTGEIVPSPRKKRRKQDVIATEDQYASNVPNSIRAEGATTVDDNHLPTSPRQQSSAVTMVTRARGRTEDDRVVPPVPPAHPTPPEAEKVEMNYLSQLRQPQWPINGLYRTHYRAACNHFKRHADIKHIELETVTATGIANDKTAVVRASGWKIHRLDPQIEDMLQVERDILETMKKVAASISNLKHCTSCHVPPEVLAGFGEVMQGNVARSNRIISHLETTRTKMIKLLDHKPTVMDLLRRYTTTKHTSPINFLPHKLRT